MAPIAPPLAMRLLSFQFTELSTKISFLLDERTRQEIVKLHDLQGWSSAHQRFFQKCSLSSYSVINDSNE